MNDPSYRPPKKRRKARKLTFIEAVVFTAFAGPVAILLCAAAYAAIRINLTACECGATP